MVVQKSLGQSRKRISAKCFAFVSGRFFFGVGVAGCKMRERIIRWESSQS